MLTAASGAALPRGARSAAPDLTEQALAALEATNGGRLGVVAVDTASGRRIAYRADERFPMCSTHKLLSAAAILAMVEAGRITLDQQVPYGPADLLDYAPVTRKHVDAGSMTVDALCAAAVAWSDNTAGNLLLRLIGGPEGWTRYIRSIGDPVSRLDRVETALNTAIPGDPRDTTTPEAMVRDLRAILVGNALNAASRARLEGWMFDSPITGALLRAGLPSGWRVGDKSGAGERGSRNDIGIILPPDGTPVLAAVFYTGSDAPPASRDKTIADVGRLIAKNLGG
jgi:beta-lactamase class A